MSRVAWKPSGDGRSEIWLGGNSKSWTSIEGACGGALSGEWRFSAEGGAYALPTWTGRKFANPAIVDPERTRRRRFSRACWS